MNSSGLLLALIAGWYLVSPTHASGAQMPIPGNEDIPELVSQSPLVCKGEVVRVTVQGPARAPDARPHAPVNVALVRVDRFYKGGSASNPIQVVFSPPPDPLSPGLTLEV